MSDHNDPVDLDETVGARELASEALTTEAHQGEDEVDSTDEPVAIDEPKKQRVKLPRPSSRRWGMNPEDRIRVMESVLVLPSSGWVMHFGVLMSMSVTVAIMGLSANSPALVIGAMLIAPLMTPVLGIAASLAMALGDAVIRTVTTVVVATVGAILFSYVVAGWLPGGLLTNEVLSRTAPDARDLVVALAAGVAGAYATARPDVSSSLPGVAIAVALVPPLAVVGVSMRAGEGALARGALLLYGTNLAAIVTVSTAVFIVTGFVPGRRLSSVAPRVIAGAFAGLVVVFLLGLLLVIRSLDSAEDAREVAEIRQATDSWLGTGFNEFEVEVTDTDVRILVTGPQPPPASSALAREVESILGEQPDLRVTWFQAETNDSLRAAEAADATVARWQAAEPQIRDAIAEWLASSPGDATFTLDDLAINSDGLLIEVASPVQHPPREDLSSLLEDMLADPIPVSVNWRDLSAEAQLAEQQSIAEAESAARLEVQAWADERDVDVVSVSFDGSTLLVDLVGQVAPDGSDLEPLLTNALPPGADVRVYFIGRNPVIPAPTLTPEPTPTPSPTPTTVPTSTPAPTPDLDATPDPEATPIPEPTP